MNSKATVDFVKCLVKDLYRKFSGQEEETPADKLCDELLEFSRHFQKQVLDHIHKIPAKVIDNEVFFIRFLDSVCSDICKEPTGVEDSDERKFFVMCGFIMTVATLSFTIPCYRMIQNIATVLISQLQQNVSLTLDSEVSVAFKNMEGKCLQMASDIQWIRRCLRLYLQSIPEAAALCPVIVKRPNIASRLVYLVDFGTSNFATGDVRRNEPCKFCSKDCKSLLETFLSGESE